MRREWELEDLIEGWTPGLLEGFLAKTHLDLTPSSNPHN